MDNFELRKLIDCCRPDSTDLADPEFLALARALRADPLLAQQWQAIGHWDNVIGRAMHEVPVPVGLSDRLVAAVGSDVEADLVTSELPVAELRSPTSAVPEPIHVEPRSATDPVIPDDASLSRPSLVPERHRPRRRRIVAIGGLCTAAAATLLIVWLHPWSDPLTGRQAADMGRLWIETLDHESWLVAAPPLARYPLDPSVRFSAVRWQSFPALDDRHATAYRTVLMPDRSVTYLLVIRTARGSSMSSIPPEVPQSSTEGLCIGAWKSRGLLYVLIVHGSQQQYRRVLSNQSFA